MELKRRSEEDRLAYVILKAVKCLENATKDLEGRKKILMARKEIYCAIGLLSSLAVEVDLWFT